MPSSQASLSHLQLYLECGRERSAWSRIALLLSVTSHRRTQPPSWLSHVAQAWRGAGRWSTRLEVPFSQPLLWGEDAQGECLGCASLGSWWASSVGIGKMVFRDINTGHFSTGMICHCGGGCHHLHVKEQPPFASIPAVG